MSYIWNTLVLLCSSESKAADRMANSVDPDQTVPLRAI